MKNERLENERLQELDSYSILDSLPDDDYDSLTSLASEICNTPISLITLVDKNRQWFKSNHGLEINETPRAHSFCAHAIENATESFFIKDARLDARFEDNPLVKGDPFIVFYAGVPLISEGGHALGTLCVIDSEPRDLTGSQKKALEYLAIQVMKLLELRRSKYQLKNLNARLASKTRILEKFAAIAASNINSPLKIISKTYESFIQKFKGKLDQDSLAMLEPIDESARKLTELVKGLLANAKLDRNKVIEKEEIEMGEFSKQLLKLFPKTDDYRIDFFFRLESIVCNKIMLEEVFIQLISNAIRHNDKVMAHVEVGGREDDQFYEFFISDNGPGVSASDIPKSFEMFTVLNQVGRYGEYGVGVGLANAKKIVKELGGEIEMEAQKGEGTIVTFSIAKRLMHFQSTP